MNDYLLKFGNTILPSKYIMSDGYVITPNQRTELEAYRDADIELHRVTSRNFKTSISLTTCPMSLSDKIEFQSIIEADMEIIERKVRITYWNDETNEYSVGDFYVSDTTFSILGYFGGERWYKPATFQFIEY